MTAQFGLISTENPVTMPANELRDLLSAHGVLLFRNNRMPQQYLNLVMSKLGKLQDWEEQQAPKSHTDRLNPALINLHNEDFLGKTRMAWHMDQTYLTTPYLPIRCLYSPLDPTPGNITSFVDIKTFTTVIEEEYPELLNEQAEYFIGGKKENSTIRPVFSYCEHVNMNLFRLDNRMRFINDKLDLEKVKQVIHNAFEKTSRFDVEWQKWDFVIFDNNQCPHRRSEMTGECRLQRLTSTFWLV
jgi:alpha-ketoglutarate-dependent taurine dioxygenase